MLKLKPRKALKPLYDKCPDLEIRINELVAQRWEEEMQMLQDKLKEWTENSPGGCKVVQDCRSNMPRARIDFDLTPISFDTIIELFDHVPQGA